MQEELGTNKNGANQKKNIISKKIGLVVAFLAVALISAVLTFALAVNYFYVTLNEEYRDLAIVKKYIDRYSYYDADHDAMIDAALKAYVGATGDRYTVYYNAEEFDSLNEDNEGRYVGIGVTVTPAKVDYMDDKLSLFEVLKVAEDSPAQAEGILVGDMIYSLYYNGTEVFADDVGMDVLSSMIRGEEGSYAELSILRPTEGGYEKIEFSIQRRRVENKSVSYAVSERAPDIGIITISQFDLNTPTLLAEAYESFENEGISKIIIDLRDNPGGDLYSVIACASYFVNEGDVIISAENNAQKVTTYDARQRTYTQAYSSCNVSKDDIGRFRDFETVVLVNMNTASAAELLTAVFRDYGLATVIGETTFGKGVMQTVYSLEEYGVEGAIKITTNVYFPPCGENYDGVGIVPDIYVMMTDVKNDNQLSVAIEALSK